MTTYTIVPNGDGTGFNISIAGSNGARQTMLGFETEAEAETWILQDKRLSAIPAPQRAQAEPTTAYG
jgi:hypothetical protein